jgi:hypothetical protein
MKYIFVAGAPGSKWSSVVKNIYYSKSIDTSDYSDSRTYYHDASGEMQLMHLGAYFDPHMEFGDKLHLMPYMSKHELEAEFDRPFSGEGVRIIKSHVFCHHLGFIRKTWPDCPIICVERDNDACLGWWVRCGHFDITYPSYTGYYKNLREISFHIDKQNADLKKFIKDNPSATMYDNIELCEKLGIDLPVELDVQNYKLSNINVYLNQNVA